MKSRGDGGSVGRPRVLLSVMLVASLCFVLALSCRAGSADNQVMAYATLLVWVSSIAWLACAFLAIRPLIGEPGAGRRDHVDGGTRLYGKLRPAIPAIVCVAVMLLSAWMYKSNMRDFSDECYIPEDFSPYETVREADGNMIDPVPEIITDHPEQRRKALRQIGRDAVASTDEERYEWASAPYTSSWRDPVGVQHCSYSNAKAGVDASWRLVHQWTTVNISVALAAYAIAFCVFARRLTSAYKAIYSDDTPPDPEPKPGEPSVGPASGA